MQKEKTFDQITYQNQYIKDKYDVIRVAVPKGSKDDWTNHAKQSGDKTLTAFIVRAVQNQIVQDGGDVAAWDALAPGADQEVTK